MPYVANRGTRIYYEVAGEGPPLLMRHSFTRCLETWRDLGYAQELRKYYRLVLIDARGHGKSDRPHDPTAYRPELMVGDVTAVLDDLGIEKAHFYGYSMGGSIGFRIAKYALDRFHSLTLGGMSPYPRRTEAEKEFIAGIRRQLEVGVEKGMEAAVALMEQADVPMPPRLRERELDNNPRALLAAFDGFREWPGVEDVLPHVTAPCLLYAGTVDPLHPGAREAAAQMPNATFVSLPGLAHSEALYRGDLALPHVKQFLAGAGV